MSKKKRKIKMKKSKEPVNGGEKPELPAAVKPAVT